MLNITEKQPQRRFALFNLGFRPFFLLGSGFAVAAIGLWMGVWIGGWQPALNGLPVLTWHAHEMIFGYSAAVIAGFLLTAVHNWTSRPTLAGNPLALLALLWAAPRIMLAAGDGIPLGLVAGLEALFFSVLIIALCIPIIRGRQWKHLTIMALLVGLLASNLLFYAGVTGWHPQAQQWGLYLGLYLVIALILLMARRVIPFFIEKGVDTPVTLTNRRWLDSGSVVIYLLFVIATVFGGQPAATSGLAAMLAVLHTIRMRDWYTPGIWRKPLLWVLYTGYGSLVLGFALKAIEPFAGISPFLGLHAFAVGGVGLITLGMMARVALGHTGRNVFEPPAVVTPIFALLGSGAVVRVLLPLLLPADHYRLLIGVSQGLWIAAFALFVLVYAPMLWSPRSDGQPG